MVRDALGQVALQSQTVKDVSAAPIRGGNPTTARDHLGFSVLDDYAYGLRHAGPPVSKASAVAQHTASGDSSGCGVSACGRSRTSTRHKNWWGSTRTLLQELVHAVLTNPALLGAFQHPTDDQAEWIKAVGFARDKDGGYDSTGNAPQLWAGYTGGYDAFFDATIPMKAVLFPFQYKGKDVLVEGWKADYGNLGAGGEMAMYEQVGSSRWGAWGAKYPVGDIPKITTSVTNANTGAQIAYSAPNEPQPWVATMNPNVQVASPDDLTVTSTLTFTNFDIYDSFYKRWGPDPRLKFDSTNHIVKVTF